jgi:hypothetical protein
LFGDEILAAKVFRFLGNMAQVKAQEGHFKRELEVL